MSSSTGEIEHERRVAALREFLEQTRPVFIQVWADDDDGGIGFAAALAHDVIAAVTISRFRHGQVLVSYGIARDLPREFERIVWVCNWHNRVTTPYPVYLDHADTGWDVLMTLVLPTQLLSQVPRVVEQWTLDESLVTVVRDVREQLAEAGVVGAAYTWHRNDAERLVRRTM